MLKSDFDFESVNRILESLKILLTANNTKMTTNRSSKKQILNVNKLESNFRADHFTILYQSSLKMAHSL